MRILITGSREWSDRAAIEDAIVKAARDAGATPQSTVIVHGKARGADTIAADIGRRYGCLIEGHKADWDRWGKSAGHRRNGEMVAAGADICLAFLLPESVGTRDCIAQARKAGIPVIVHERGGLQADLMSELVRISQGPHPTPGDPS